MFCGELDNVKNTKILVAKVFPCQVVDAVDRMGRNRKFKKPTGPPLQLTIYSNQISLVRNPVDEQGRSNTAMILPFPIIPGAKNRFKIFPMTKYGNIFDDLEMLFPDLPQKPARSEDMQLPTMNIGSYSVSVAKDLEQLSRVNPKVFKTTNDLIQLAGQYYPKNFGFLICILKTNAQYHPLGYVHEIRSDGKLFIPTRHHHVQDKNSKYSMNQFSNYHEWQTGQDGEIDLGTASGSGRNSSIDLDNHFHDTIMQEDRWMRHQVRRNESATQINKQARLDWDHQIYIVNHTPKLKNIEVPLPDRLTNVYSYLSMNLMPQEITFNGIKTVVRLVLDNKTVGNRDLYI